MATFITQGRYTREAIKGMIVKPEDRFEALSKHAARAGGRVIGYYLTFGEYDFLSIIEAPVDPVRIARIVDQVIERLKPDLIAAVTRELEHKDS